MINPNLLPKPADDKIKSTLIFIIGFQLNVGNEGNGVRLAY